MPLNRPRLAVSPPTLLAPSLEKEDSFDLSETGTFSKEDITMGREGIGGRSNFTLDDLEVQRTLGSGASSTVRLVKDRVSGASMALKELNVMCDQDTMHMTINEIKILHKAHSDHLVSFIDAFFDNGRIYLALEFCDAGSLDDVIKATPAEARPRIPESAMAEIVSQSLEGLKYLHQEQKQVHRDLKPANIMLTRKGEVKLGDFGISKQLDNTLALAVTQCGTTAYMSPERIKGAKYAYDADIWALGLIFLEMCSGEYPYPAARNFMQMVMRICEGPVPTVQAGIISEAAEHFVMSCLAKVPSQRPSASKLMQHEWLVSRTSSPQTLHEFLEGQRKVEADA
jgi:serine/threonine protein kinase